LGRKPNYNFEKRNKELQRKKKREEKLRIKRESQEAARRNEVPSEPDTGDADQQD
jgi:hypothetical protein